MIINHMNVKELIIQKEKQLSKGKLFIILYIICILEKKKLQNVFRGTFERHHSVYK